MNVSHTKQLEILSLASEENKEFTEFVLKQNLQSDEQKDCEKIFQYLRYGFGEATYERFLKHIKYAGIRSDRNAIILTVKNEFIKGVILQSYFREISTFVYNNCKIAKKIEIAIKPVEVPITKSVSKQVTQYQPKQKTDISISFDDFIEGDSNRLAYHSAKQVADMILSNNYYNTPSLCIFGPVGMGKTHLMKSIVSHIKSSEYNCKIEYISAENFKNSYIEAVRTNNLFNFKQRFTELDALLLDDIQFICSGTGSLEREFERILNNLVDNRKWVVIACDRAPSNLKIDARTQSRISSGLKVSIQPSDFNLRMLILKSKIQKMYNSYYIPLHVLEYIAANVMTSIRELEAILHNIIAYANVMQVKTIKDSIVHEILGRCDFSRNEKIVDVSVSKNVITFESIMQMVCEYYKIRKSDVLGISRIKKISQARAIIAYLARNETCMTLKEIGQELQRSHATIIYLVNLVSSDKDLLSDTKKLIQKYV